MSAHTPGPWEVALNRTTDTRVSVVASSTGVWVADARPWNLSSRAIAEQEANARLIALAPEMLEALRQALEALEEAGNHFDHGNAAAAQQALGRYFELWSDDTRALLAKADGR